MAAMINWTLISDRQEYENQRYSLLLRIEEGGAARLDPYNDGANPGAGGFITIGVGFNLEGLSTVRDAVFAAFGLIRNNPALSTVPPVPGQFSAQQVENEYISRLITEIGKADNDFTALNAVMAERAADPRLNALGQRRNVFAFSDEDEVKAVFNDLMTRIYEPVVDGWLAGVPDSAERVALVSLAWGNIVKPGASKRLRAAIVSGDRAEAWYEIRYNSNSPTQSFRDGIAKRRYFEADTFGLYDVSAEMTDQAAKGAFRTYTRHAKEIDAYDAQFGGLVANANHDYSTTVVLSRTDWFAPAFAYLRDTYFASVGGVNLSTILVGENDGTDGGVDTRYYRANAGNAADDRLNSQRFNVQGTELANNGNPPVFSGDQKWKTIMRPSPASALA